MDTIYEEILENPLLIMFAARQNPHGVFNRFICNEDEVPAPTGAGQFPAQGDIFVSVDKLKDSTVQHIGEHGDLCLKRLANGTAKTHNIPR